MRSRKNMLVVALSVVVLGIAASARANTLTQENSSQFTWRYDWTDANGANKYPSWYDLDANGTGDWGYYTTGTGNWSLTNGVWMFLAPSPAGSNNSAIQGGANANQILANSGITVATGYTVEFSAKVDSQVAGTNGALGLEFNPGGSTNKTQTVLNISSTGESWGGYDFGPTTIGTAVDNTDGFHIFRVAQLPGQASFTVWRDGVQLASGLGTGSGAVATEGASLNFGAFGGRWAGTSEDDYIRFTPGAYAPIPEPSSVVLLISASIGLLAYAWRKRR